MLFHGLLLLLWIIVLASLALPLQLLDENLAQLRNDVSLGMNDVRAGRVAPLDIEGIKMRARQIHEGQAVGD